MYRSRTPRPVSIRQKLLMTFVYLVAGAALGALAKLFDLYTDYLGTIFSELSVWFLIGVAIALAAPSPLCAAGEVLSFCAGMLTAYYLTAQALGAVWGMAYAHGWTLFALCLPLFAFFTWFAGGRGRLALVLRVGILLVMTAAQLVIYRLRVTDMLLIVLTAWLLFRRRRK